MLATRNNTNPWHSSHTIIRNLPNRDGHTVQDLKNVAAEPSTLQPMLGD